MRAPRTGTASPIVALLLLAGTAAAPPAGAVAETSPLTVPTAQFIDWFPNEGNGLIRSITQGNLTGTGTGENGFAAIHLPDGARVTALVGGLLDNDAAEDAPLYLFRRRISTNPNLGQQQMAVVTPTGASATVRIFRDETIEFATIDNSLYIYWLAANVDSDNSLYSVQIEFELPIFIDGFESGDTSAWSSTTP